MTDISVVIPTFNRKDILKRTLEALLDQTYPKDKYEIIVVDDGSSEDIKRMIEDLRAGRGKDRFETGPNITYLRQASDKKGPAAANNLGIKKALGEYILLLNNDVIADRCLIEEHMMSHRRHPDSIVQGRVINTSSLEDLKQEHKGYSGGYSNISFGYFTTWNLSIKKDILTKAGLFDEDFRHLCWEDVEFGFRLRKMKVRQVNNKNAFGHHFKHEFFVRDIGKVKEKSFNMGSNAMIYYRKHPCLEVKISTESFWLPMAIHGILSFFVRAVGNKRLYGLMKGLEDNKNYRLLAFVVGLSGKYWYWSGVKKALALKRTPEA